MGKIQIKCFETPIKKYFYDRCLDSIVMVDDSEYELLKEVEKTGKISNEQALTKYTSHGFLQESKIEKIEHPEMSSLKMLTEHYMGNLILQVTQQCNMRCAYCAYSGLYTNRTHAAKRMSFDTAKKAIDFYFERSDKADHPFVSFYGGEPLLEFELIKECVDYIEKYKHDKTVKFSMTTNGTLLTEEVISFLIKHKFTIMISLDGDKKSHDVNRRFNKGNGSFDTVISNLKKLKEYDEQYYKENVMFNCVISSSTDLESVYSFYSNSELFYPGVVNLNYVNSIGIKDEQMTEMTNKNRRIEALAYLKMVLSILGKREWDPVSLMLRRQLQDVELLYRQLHKHSMEPKKIHHGGPCIPAVRRIFVDINGNFFPCERVSETDEEMCIGSLDFGFEYERMEMLINHGERIENDCLSCWNLRTCTFCLAEIEKNNKKLTEGMLVNQCKKSKRRTLYLFYRLCLLVELGYRGNENLAVRNIER